MIPTWLQKLIQQTIFFTSTAYTCYMIITDPQWIYLLWFVIGMVVVAGVVSAYYHRFVTHYAWECPKWAEVMFLYLGAMFAFTQVLSWAATHNKHHRYVDTDRDPHGPHTGIWNNLMIAYYDFNMAHANKTNLRNPLYQAQMKYYLPVAIIGFVIMSVLFGPISWAIINTYGFLGQASVNYLGHKDGKAISRPYLAWLLAGETYHDHHHQHPRDPIFGKWDLGAAIVRLLDKNVK